MTSFWMNSAIALLLGYGFGSIPFGLLLTKAAGQGDIREIGSGNIGATNVLRTGNKGLAAATLLLDLMKGFAAVYIARIYLPGSEPVAAAGAFFGHLYPLWIGFRGGKGVATFAGIMFGLFWQGGVVYAVAWIGALAIFRISAVAGLIAAAAAPLAAYWFGRVDLLAMVSACSLLVFWKHKANIERLLQGTEPRIGRSKH
jgi:acyl phosphate:glycerol-3-phosphate acyltransferase